MRNTRNMRYAVVVEQGESSVGAYVPDLPGCIAAAETREEVLELIQEAIAFHIEGLREGGQSVPEPSSSIEYVDIRAA
jgi:predicted RNase H-like HicB family nuclease